MTHVRKSLILLATLSIAAVATSMRNGDAAADRAAASTTTSLHDHALAAAELKHFGKPDEVREFPLGRVELVKIGGVTLGRAIFQPGWKWSTSVQPLAKTKSCEAPHFQYHVYGILMVKMDDGTEIECHPGDVSLLPSGHDAWVVGNEPAIVMDFQGMMDYAKSK